MMKKLVLALSLTVASCVGVQSGNVPVADGPVARTIERVLDRTQDMVDEDGLAYSDDVAAAAEVARTMLLLPEASGTMLFVTMSPIMGLHDDLVSQRLMDGRFDQLEAEVYWEDTARLRSLFNAVSIHQQ